MDEKIKIIAENYGYEAQSRQLIEEMAELTQAINKLWRKQKYGGSSSDIQQARDNVIEEIADVTIMLKQVKELLKVDESSISDWVNLKLDRQVSRILYNSSGGVKCEKR